MREVFVNVAALVVTAFMRSTADPMNRVTTNAVWSSPSPSRTLEGQYPEAPRDLTHARAHYYRPLDLGPSSFAPVQQPSGVGRPARLVHARARLRRPPPLRDGAVAVAAGPAVGDAVRHPGGAAA